MFRAIRLLAALIWLFAITLSYYVVHKPFALENALALLDAVANLVTAGMVSLLALGLGRRVTRGFVFTSALEASCFRGGLGLGLISFATFGLGIVGALNPILFWGIFLSSLSILRNELFALVGEFRMWSMPISSRVDRILATFVAGSLFIGLLFALTPPVGWDAQTYHLVQAQRAMDLGRITPPPDIVHFSFPALGDMLFLAMMVLRGDIAAQLTHFLYFILLLGLVNGFATRYWGTAVSWRAIAILVAVPSLLTVSTKAYVDATLSYYTFAAFYALMIAFEKNEAKWTALSGAFAGFAVGVKYTGLLVPVVLLALILLRDRFLNLGSATRFTIFTLAFGLIFYLRNLLFTGNPIYPFVFGGSFWDSFRAEYYSRFGSGLITAPLELLTVPWTATILGSEGKVAYAATIGPLLLTFLPFLLLPAGSDSKSKRSIVLYLLLVSSSLYLFWLYGLAQSKLLMQTRLLFPAFAFFALLASVAFERLGAFDLAWFSLERFARMLLLFVLGLTVLSYSLALISHNPLAYLIGAVPRDTYLERALGGYFHAAQFINTQLPPDSKILALWEPRSYYVQRTIQPDTIPDFFPHQLSRTRDPDSIAAEWRRVGYTHVLLYRKGLNELITTQYDPITWNDVRVLQKVLLNHARLLYGEPLEIGNDEVVRADTVPYSIYALEVR